MVLKVLEPCLLITGSMLRDMLWRGSSDAVSILFIYEDDDAQDA